MEAADLGEGLVLGITVETVGSGNFSVLIVLTSIVVTLVAVAGPSGRPWVTGGPPRHQVGPLGSPGGPDGCPGEPASGFVEAAEVGVCLLMGIAVEPIALGNVPVIIVGMSVAVAAVGLANWPWVTGGTSGSLGEPDGPPGHHAGPPGSPDRSDGCPGEPVSGPAEAADLGEGLVLGITVDTVAWGNVSVIIVGTSAVVTLVVVVGPSGRPWVTGGSPRHQVGPLGFPGGPDGSPGEPVSGPVAPADLGAGLVLGITVETVAWGNVSVIIVGTSLVTLVIDVGPSGRRWVTDGPPRHQVGPLARLVDLMAVQVNLLLVLWKLQMLVCVYWWGSQLNLLP